MYQTIADAYRKNNITLLELRFNPMKRNTGGEQDLDDIMMAAVRGDRQGVPRVLGEDGADRLLRQDVRPRSERDTRREGGQVGEQWVVGIDTNRKAFRSTFAK